MKKSSFKKSTAILVILLFGCTSLLAQTITIVDNNINNNPQTTLHGFCTGPNFTYDVYWDDTTGPAVVEVVNSGGTVIASGATSPIRDILFNTNTTATLDIRVREQGNPTNISSVVTVTRKNCVATEVNQTDFTNTGTNVTFTVPTAITHIRASVIGGGGNGGRRGGGNSSATSGGGGGASAISTFAVVANETFTVDVGAGRTGSNGSGRSATQVSSISNGSGSIVSAEGGDGSGQGSGTGGDGGRASASIGQQTFNGGRGGNRSNNNANGIFGRGGGAGHFTGSGTNGTFSVTGQSVTPGGRGGNVGTGAGVAAGGGGAGKGSFGSGGNGGNGARGLARIETYNTDVIAPTVTVEQESNQSDPAIKGNIKFTATFSEPIVVNSLACDDIILAGTATASCATIIEVGPNDGTTFEITINASSLGTVIVSLPEASAHDLAGNNNEASTSEDNTITVINAPGGVASNLALWLKADGDAYNTGTTQAINGQAVETWVDASANVFNATNGGTDGQVNPIFDTTNPLNFNPTLSFDAANAGLDLGSNRIFSTNNGMSTFIVAAPAGATDSEIIIDVGNFSSEAYGITYSTSEYGFYSPSTSGGVGVFDQAHTFDTNPVLLESDINFGTTHNFLINGLQVNTGNISGLSQLTSTEISVVSGPMRIGRMTKNLLGTQRYFTGKIAEVIVYNDDVTDAQQIQSYLALKYGITLDATSVADYLDSSGSSVYDMATFSNDVFGIANDNRSDLDQQISKSINTGAIVTITTDTDFTGANGTHSSLTDGQFLVIGNDGGDPSMRTSLESPNGLIGGRINREWKLTNTNGVATASFKFDGFDDTATLLFDDNGDFSEGTQSSVALNANGEAVSVDLTINTGQYVTLLTARPYITTWKTDNPGSATNQITIPLVNGQAYNFTVDWGDGCSSTVVGNDITDITHIYDGNCTTTLDALSTGTITPISGTSTASGIDTYTVTISGTFPGMVFNGIGDKDKVLSIEQWGDIQWREVRGMFRGATNVVNNATDAPDLSILVQDQLGNMFRGATNIGNGTGSWNWDVSDIISFSTMFHLTAMNNADLINWDVSSGQNFSGMFNSTPFNQDIGDWNMSAATSLSGMFANTTDFNQDISTWERTAGVNGATTTSTLANVINFSQMFRNTDVFNQNIGNWNVSAAENFSLMFFIADVFNQDISSWERVNGVNGATSTSTVANVTNFSSMFQQAPDFNQPIGNWNMSGAINTSNMFLVAQDFNQDLGNWNTAAVTNMSRMFESAGVFNQDLNNWNTAAVTNMEAMFKNATAFDQDLSGFEMNALQVAVNSLTFEITQGAVDMLDNSGLSLANYDATLIGWASQSLDPDGELGAAGLDYCLAQTEHDNGLGAGWTITGDNFNCPPAPGGVNPDLSLWFKADGDVQRNGATSQVTQWVNESVNIDISQQPTITASTDIVLNDNSINSNPAVEFTGAVNKSLKATTTNSAMWDGAISIYAVTIPQTDATGIRGILNTDTKGFMTSAGEYVTDANGNVGAETPLVVNQPTLASVTYTQNSIANTRTFIDGEFRVLETAATASGITNFFEIGGRTRNGTQNTGRIFDGEIAEVILFSSEHIGASTERIKIESYLALKYGITLNQPNTDYLASDGSDMWNFAKSGELTPGLGLTKFFASDIVGIGRDDASALNQKVSKSVNSDAILSVALDPDFVASNIDAARTTAHTNDLQFLVFGNDAFAIANQTTELDPSLGLNQRINREWKTQRTANFTQDVTLKFDGYAGWSLLTAGTAEDFSTGATALGVLDVNGEITVSATEISDEAVFTLGIFQEAPGGVIGNLNLWLKADADAYTTGTTQATNGQDVNAWADQSSNNYIADGDVTVNTNRPIYQDATLNFNPALNFGAGANETGFNLGSDFIFAPAANGGKHIFSVAFPSVGGAQKYIYDFGRNVQQSVGLRFSAATLEVVEGGARNNNRTVSVNSVSLAEADFVFGGDTNVRLNGDAIDTFSTMASEFTEAEVIPGVSIIAANPMHSAISGPVSIGRQAQSNSLNNSGGRRFFGDMGEVIVYNADITPTEAQQVRSYLALKYGITIDQTIATDYLASDGTTKMWDATVAATHNNDIAGIGRDDASALQQRISKSVNSNALVSFSIEDDFVKGNTDGTRADIAADLSFMVWANDNGSTASWTTTAAPANRSILPRIWKIDETGTMGTVHISVPDNSSALATKLPAENTTIYLLTDTDTNFSNATETALTLNGTNWELPVGIDLADATFFTFATQVSNLAANSIVTATSPIEADGTAISTITVQLVDANGTYLTTSSGIVTLATTGNAVLSSVVDNNDGTYTATATNTTVETVTINATVDGNLIADTANIIFQIGAPSPFVDPVASIVTATSPIEADGTATSNITVQLYDTDGQPLTASVGTVVLNTTGDAVLSAVVDNGDGTYTATATNSTAETVTISAGIDGNNILDTADVIFQIGAPSPIVDPVASIVTATSPIEADGTATSTITIQLVDVNGVLLTASGGVVTLATTGSAVLSAVVDNGDGTYTATASNAVAETVTISAEINGTEILNTADVIFMIGAPTPIIDPVASIVTATSPIEADGTATSTITIQLYDTDGNPLTASGGTVTLATTGSAVLSAVTDNGDGTYTATATNAVAETVMISAEINGTEILDTADVIFMIGAPTPIIDPVASIVTATSPIEADGTAISTITIQLVDVNGNPLTASGGTVTLATTGAAVLTAVVDNGDGTYTATATNATAETVTINASIGGNDILDTADVIFEIGAPTPIVDPVASIVTATSPIEADGTATSTITVQLYDTDGNPLTASGGTVTLETTGSAVLSAVVDNGDGTYTATATNTVAETVTISAEINGTEILNIADIIFMIGAPNPTVDPVASIVTATSPIEADGTATSTITIQLVDTDGQPLTASGGTVVLSTTGNAVLSAVVDNGDGTYTATAVNSTAETVTISAGIDGNNILDTADIIFQIGAPVPTVDPVASIVTATSPIEADGAATSNITVQLYDTDGQPLTASGGTVVLSTTGDAVLSAVVDNGDGTYTATATNAVAETVTISAEINGTEILDTADVIFQLGAPVPTVDPVASIVTATSPIEADGTATSTITIQLVDVNGVPLTTSGGVVTLATTGSALLSAVVDNGDGTYTATATNAVAETVTISAEINGTEILDTADAIFQIGAPVPTVDPVASIVTATSPIEADGTATSTITVQLYDTDGQPLTASGGTVVLSTTGSAILSAVVDNGDGTYTATATNAVAETVTISAEINGTEILDTADVIFEIGAPTPIIDPVASIVTATSPIEADGTATSTITIQLVDVNGVLLTASGGAITSATTGSAVLSAVVDNGDGTYTATATNVVEETVIISAEINSTEILDTADVIFMIDAPGPIVLEGTDSQLTAIDPIGFINNTANPGTVEITLVDDNGSPIIGALVSISNDDVNNTLSYITAFSGITDTNGKFTVDVTNTEVEVINFTAMLDSEGDDIVDLPIPLVAPSAVSFVDETGPAPGAPYPLVLAGTASQMTAIDDISFVNDTSNLGTVEITLVDASGNPIVGALVAFANDDTNSTMSYISNFIGFTDANGKFTVDVTNSEAELINFSAMVDSDGVGGVDLAIPVTTPSAVNFINGNTDITNPLTRIEATDAEGDILVLDSGAIRVTLVDSDGNPVANTAVVFITADNNASINSPDGITDSNGQYETTVSNTQIGISGFSVFFDDNGDGIVDTDDTLVINGDTADVTFSFDPNGDEDGDGITNGEEDTNSDGDPNNDDCDEDGTPNWLDPDPCGEVGSISTIEVAEALTPNSDGINDAWIIRGIESYPNSNIKVYNRWGHEVFRAIGYQNDWLGTYKDNSEKLPTGSYYYVINLGDGSPFIDGWLFINY